jgi:hypothetical protein
MKKQIIFAIVIIVGLIILSLPKGKKETPTQSYAPSRIENNTEKLKLLMSKEPSVKDFVLTEVGVLYISVSDDGTRRDGLAEYFCQTMKDESINIKRVKIVKFGSSKDPNRDNSYGVLLGECWCK